MQNLQNAILIKHVKKIKVSSNGQNSLMNRCFDPFDFDYLKISDIFPINVSCILPNSCFEILHDIKQFLLLLGSTK